MTLHDCDCVDEPPKPSLPNPCPPPCPSGDLISLENPCPARVALPSPIRGQTAEVWLTALAKNLCTLNPQAIRGSNPCSVLTTVADPLGGSVVQPKSILEMLACAPFTKAGQGFVFDGATVKVVPISQNISTLPELVDGPGFIQEDGFLVGLSDGRWEWKAGCLPPCPAKGGLVLQSTTSNGLQWGPLQPIGIQCLDLKAKLNSCINDKVGKPTKILGFGEDNCVTTPFKFDFCDALKTGLKDCIVPKVGDPTTVLGFDADGNPWEYKIPKVEVDCVALKAASPKQLPGIRPEQVMGVAADFCGRFVRDCDVDFRAKVAAGVVVTETKLVSAWGTDPMYVKFLQEYNTGDCAGTFGLNAKGDQQYTIKADGRYSIEASSWIRVKFAANGPGVIHADCIWSIIGSVMMAKAGGLDEYRIGQASDSIDYCYDPGNVYTVNNCTRGLTVAGLDFFFTRTMVHDLKAGDFVSVPRFRCVSVHNATDLTATLQTRTDGESCLSVTKMANHSF